MSVGKVVVRVLLVCLVGFVGLGFFEEFKKDRKLHPAEVVLEAYAGTGVVARYSRRITNSSITVSSSIDATPEFNPPELPQGLEVLESTIAFSGESTYGHLLFWVPEQASGTMTFSVHATGTGTVMGLGIMEIESEPAEFTIQILPGSVENGDPPRFEGIWSESGRDNPMIWRFGDSSELEITDRSGESTNLRFHLVPDGDRRWFLVPEGGAFMRRSFDPERAYWIDMMGDSIAVAYPGEAGSFEPFAMLHKGPN